MAVILHTPDWAVGLYSPLPSRNPLDSVLEGKSEFQSAIFLSKTETWAFPFATAQKRRQSARAPKAFGGRGFKWREPRHNLGRKPFKPQTALLRWSRAVGQSRCPAKGGSARAERAIRKERVSPNLSGLERRRLVWSRIPTFAGTGRSAKRGSARRAPSSFTEIRAEGRVAESEPPTSFSVALLVGTSLRTGWMTVAQEAFFAMVDSIARMHQECIF